MCFIPILWKYVGSLENPWVTKGLVSPMQIIWDGVMQDWPHRFAEDEDKVYCLVNGYLLSLHTAILTLNHIRLNSACKRFTTGACRSVRLR